jgi:hypothetical protein
MSIGANWWRVPMAVLPLCDAFGGSVTSYFRTEAHNLQVGGVGSSRHVTGEAMDVLWEGGNWPDLATLQAWCLPYSVQVVRERAKNHDHFEYEPKLERIPAS